MNHIPTNRLIIRSPKRKTSASSKRDEFFPYYAGFPESFASSIIESAGVRRNGMIFDPWNGSGTTTYSALRLGHNARGIDLNPVMVVVARARNLAPSEVQAMKSDADRLSRGLTRLRSTPNEDDPLLEWFSFASATIIRNLEKRIRSKYLPTPLINPNAIVDSMSRADAALYVAIFGMCRGFTHSFKASNPTWLRKPKDFESKIEISPQEIRKSFLLHVSKISESAESENFNHNANIEISVGNATNYECKEFADLILTSPPYCTRLDYTAATRIELAVLNPLLDKPRELLSREMIGSIRVPSLLPELSPSWGPTCLQFLKRLRSHESKASSGYYYKTHVDYFGKMARSMEKINQALKPNGVAVLVVQDSYYKEIHNDLPRVLTEMAEANGMELFTREDFVQKNSMSTINANSRKYRGSTLTTESVICFKKRKNK